ncbi:acetolactate synthase large subunit [Salinivibrio sp. ML198]|uniref:acetolactate synthase AlsS n=1 Tax=unclassified Salinivibrio TaxID=2636825 RepID=UPI000985D039|nr:MULTISPECIES: acetolactate synthase AlsS [unclassified Salinivibrio]OOE69676.1 acetolactate synthase large subunit [Salinivibrio sp. IB868]OOE73489.1 acetolactate synthase large subunit [Salinivibrio sp. IB870]OOE79442.1 acetolactate synthase large subunit [Salinivibrio sp. ML198]
MTTKTQWDNGAQLIANHLEQQGVEYIFGIPGAKIDRLFDAVEDTNIKMIPIRHEANGAFMAGVVGRLTGKAGVTMVTSGPGCANLVTGLATATSEGDPLVALGGAVKRADQQKQTHQSLDTVSVFRSVTKYSAEVQASTAASEILANAFRSAESGRPGAAFVSLPMDILNEPVESDILAPTFPAQPGMADTRAISEAANKIKAAKNPVFLLGLQASRPENAAAIRTLLNRTQLPVLGTYQAAGTVDISYYQRFAGRVGLFNNQPGDLLLANADLIITIGFSPIEYDPELWNTQHTDIVHIDVEPAEIEHYYRPSVELVGQIEPTLKALTEQLDHHWLMPSTTVDVLEEVAHQRQAIRAYSHSHQEFALHPLHLIKVMQDVITPDTTLCLDMGSFHIWIARYLNCFRSRQLLVSNGQQTMGVALPWGIGASLLNPDRKVVSVSGDGGFMQSSMELETAVRLKCNLLHIIWVDNAYNMVEMQEVKKYQRFSGVKFGPIDFKAYAEAFGAKGFAVTRQEDLASQLKQAMDTEGPAVIAIPVDYSDNYKLMAPREAGSMDPVFA